jgi:putative transposase
MQNLKYQLAQELAKECKSVEEVHDLLKELFRGTLEEILEAEMEEHLGYEKHSVLGNNTGNSRNGYSKKTIKAKMGETELKIPRDRNGQFEPKIIRKYETTANEVEDQIVAMYAKGMTTRDIENHLKDIYGIEVSASLISKVTDKIFPYITEWQSRPLDKVYPIVYLDAIHFKVRKDNKVLTDMIKSA